MEAHRKEAKRANTRFLVSRLFKDHVKHQLGWLIFALLLMVVVAATTASLAFLMETILDDVFLHTLTCLSFKTAQVES